MAGKKKIEIKIKVGVIIRNKGKILLIRERHNPTREFKWNIVKGTFEPGKDSSILKTAIRESGEEANAKIKLRWFLSTYYLLDRKKALMMFTFVADLRNPKIKTSPGKTRSRYSPGEEIIEVKLFTLKEIKKLKPEDFLGMRGYLAIQDYLKGIRHPLNIINTLSPKSIKHVRN